MMMVVVVVVVVGGDFKECSRGLFLYQHLPGQAQEKEDSW